MIVESSSIFLNTRGVDELSKTYARKTGKYVRKTGLYPLG